MSKIIVSIEGNIGVGKSTFINILKNKLIDCDFVAEPVEEWKNIRDEKNRNILQAYYDDFTRWALTFQNLTLITRLISLENIILNGQHNCIFLDRSIQTDKNIFEKLLHNDGQINLMEHQIYDLYYNYINNSILNKYGNKTIYIYLRCSPEKSMERIKKRNRPEEQTISIEYLTKLHNYHDEWLYNESTENIQLNSNVVVFDCNEDFEINEDIQNNMIEQIKKIINN
jgi:deoxyadenosine/deoxycytidine kinase